MARLESELNHVKSNSNVLLLQMESRLLSMRCRPTNEHPRM